MSLYVISFGLEFAGWVLVSFLFPKILLKRLEKKESLDFLGVKVREVSIRLAAHSSVFWSSLKEMFDFVLLDILFLSLK